MRSYFETDGPEARVKDRAIVPEGPGGSALLGFNIPMASKQLFRYRHGHSCQPSIPPIDKYVVFDLVVEVTVVVPETCISYDPERYEG